MKYLGEFGAWIIAGIGTIYAFITGNTDVAFQVLLLVMIVDIVSGVMKGSKSRNLKSVIMHMGILKKGAVLLSVAFAFILDILINESTPVFSTMMTWLAIGNEGLSVVENLTALGVKIPAPIIDKLGQFSDHSKEVRDDKDGEYRD